MNQISLIKYTFVFLQSVHLFHYIKTTNAILSVPASNTYPMSNIVENV